MSFWKAGKYEMVSASEGQRHQLSLILAGVGHGPKRY